MGAREGLHGRGVCFGLLLYAACLRWHIRPTPHTPWNVCVCVCCAARKWLACAQHSPHTWVHCMACRLAVVPFARAPKHMEGLWLVVVSVMVVVVVVNA